MALVLCSAFLFTPLLSKAQTIDTTGNLVNFNNQVTSTTSTWQNAGSIGQPLTCWSGGDPGYCGPLPRVAAWGAGSNVINFSYGLTNLNQVVNINNALPNTGSGLQVNGFTFGFTAKNGNGWDDGRQDYLTAYVNIYNNTNSKVLESYNYDMNRRYNWTTFSYSETFKTPYATPDLGNANYGFIGRDNNFWVGPYGPEIMNVNFSLKYSVDPCANNPLYSTSCKGYADAFAKLMPAPAAAPPTFEPVPVAAGSPSPPPGTAPPPGSPPVQDSSQQPQQGQPQPGAAPPPGPALQQSLSQPTANNQQPKPGEVADSGGGKSASPVSLSSVLSMIGSNQEKTAALEKSVVQAADAQAFSAGETAKQTAEKIAGEAQSQSIAISNLQSTGTAQSSSTQSTSGPVQSSGLPLQGNLQSNTMFNSARLEQSLSSMNSGQSYSSSNVNFGIQQNTQNDNKQDFVFNVPQSTPYIPKVESTIKSEINTSIQIPKYEPPLTNEITGLQAPPVTIGRTQFEVKSDSQSNMQFTVLPPVKYEPPKIENTPIASIQIQQYQPPVIKQDVIVSIASPLLTNYSLMPPVRQSQTQIEMPVLDGIKFSGNKTPVELAIESRPIILQSNTSQPSDSVKRNVDNNELAGNISIDSIAKQPANYSQYFFMMPDVAFYAPKEIYKNQTNVDNIRLLRGLGSDRLHQEMINQQYKIGN